MNPPAASNPLRSTDWRILLRFVRFLVPHRRVVALSFAVLCAVFVIDLTAPYVIRLTLDGPVRQALASAAPFDAATLREILWRAALFFALSASGIALRYYEVVVFGWVGQRVAFDVRQTLFRHLLALPLRFFDRHPVGELVTRSTNDVDNLVEFFASGVAAFLFDLLRIFGVLGILYFEQPRLALVVVAVLPFFAILTFRFRQRARSAYSETRTVLARANAFTQEALSGMRVTQLCAQEPQMVRRFADLGRQLFDAWKTTVHHFAMMFSVVEILSHLILVGTFGAAAWMITKGSLTLGQWTQYWFYLNFLLGPIRELAERYNVLQSALSSAEKISRILDEPEEPGGTRRKSIEGRLTFDRVGFGYVDDQRALKSLSFQLRPGEMAAVVGATGAGKTTLAHLVLSLYRTQEGSVRVDDIDINEWSLTDLRRGIGIVPQEVFLFATSVLENLRLWDPALARERVEQACRMVGADEILKRLDGGLDAKLGERGVNLSAGERQLLAFARVLVHDPKILILDEATSSVDSHTEELLQRAVATVIRGRTCIVIAHRLSTVRSADRILVMHKGELRESGTHDALIANGGIYRRLYELQFQTDTAAIHTPRPTEDRVEDYTPMQAPNHSDSV